MLFESWSEAVEAFAESITEDNWNQLEVTGMLNSAFDGWVEATKAEWKAGSYS